MGRLLSPVAADGCVGSVHFDLRAGIVSVGSLLMLVGEAFGLTHAMAALPTAIPDVLMGLLAVLVPGLAPCSGGAG